MRKITGSMLYDFIRCPSRVWADLNLDPELRAKESAFVKLLWERGQLYEKEVVSNLKVPFTDLSSLPPSEKRDATLEAIKRRDPLIYSGRLEVDDLLGEPDLLRWNGTGYVAGDIKSGAGEESGDDGEDGKPKKHYAVQLALYTDLLERLGLSSGRTAFIWDIHGKDVPYDFTRALGVKTTETLWDVYEACLSSVRSVIAGTSKPKPALASVCKLCHWKSVCKKDVVESNDLSLIPELGRSKRDVICSKIASVKDLAVVDVSALIKGKKTEFSGVGPDTLLKFKERAALLSDPNAKPYLKSSVQFPPDGTELFFDVETDPMRGICYLHGFLERRKGHGERYVAFLASEPNEVEEKKAFEGAWQYIKDTKPTAIYYYSPYEKTTFRALQAKYPGVASAEDVNALFDNPGAIDLYNAVVRKATEWPTYDQSIKTLAVYLGFKWRDEDPSGAASIEWYHRWVQTGDDQIRKRILEYNEDDCIATRVLLDGIRRLSPKN